MQQDVPTFITPPPPSGGFAPIFTPNLQSASWWQWLLTTVLSLAVTVGVLIGHPFDSTVLSSAVPTAGLLAAAIATAIQLHGVHKVAVAAIAYSQAVHVKLLELHHAKPHTTNVVVSGPAVGDLASVGRHAADALVTPTTTSTATATP